MAGLMQGKQGLILGVANKRSIAWAIAQSLNGAGAKLAFTYQGERLKENVEKLTQELAESLVLQCDVTRPEEIKQVMKTLDEKWGSLDFIVHSLAFANAEDLQGEYVKTPLAGFNQALSISAYSLTQIVYEARALLEKASEGASVLALTYLGGERAIQGYNVMGVAKSALESSVRYLALDLGMANIRVNAISAGPINTLAARGIRGFSEILKHVRERAPLKRNTEAAEVGDTALFLSSNLARGITGEVVHVDAGYSIVGL